MNPIIYVTTLINFILIMKLMGFLAFFLTLGLSGGAYYLLKTRLTVKKKFPDLAAVVIPHAIGIIAISSFFQMPVITLAAILVEALMVIIFANLGRD